MTDPDTEPIVTDGYEELHVPPVVISASVTDISVHTAEGPVMGAGDGFTVITRVAVQPVEVME